MKRLLIILAALFCVGVFIALDVRPTTATQQGLTPLKVDPNQPERTWAMARNVDGIENFHQVSATLYRGAQPSAAGMVALTKIGIKTIVNLRTLHSDRKKIGELGLAYEHIYFNWMNPEEKEVVRFLQIVTKAERQPVFVHCQHGSDRTGVMVAVYRIFVEGWTKEEALAEMTKGDFGFHKYFAKPAIGEALTEFVRGLDIAAIKKRTGMTAAVKLIPH